MNRNKTQPSEAHQRVIAAGIAVLFAVIINRHFCGLPLKQGDQHNPHVVIEWMWIQLVLTLLCYLVACHPKLRENQLEQNIKAGWRISTGWDVWISIFIGFCLYWTEYCVFPSIARNVCITMHWDSRVPPVVNPSFLFVVKNCAIGPIAEEIAFRGTLLAIVYQIQERVTKTGPQWLLATLTFAVITIAFALAHINVGYTPYQQTIVALVGGTYGLFAIYRRSCAQSAIVHTVVNSLIAASNIPLSSKWIP